MSRYFVPGKGGQAREMEPVLGFDLASYFFAGDVGVSLPAFASLDAGQ
jgi:hypothetical protein